MLKNKNHQAILDVMNSLTDEELRQISNEVKEMQLGGPTIEEYISNFSSNYHQLFNFTKQKRTCFLGYELTFTGQSFKRKKSQSIDTTIDRPLIQAATTNPEATFFGGGLHLSIS